MNRRSTGPAAAASPAVLASRLRAAGDPPAASPVDETLIFTPTNFICVLNQTLEYTYGSVLVEGEIASFKVNQGKWVFFDLKDDESSVSCFMTLYQMRMPLEDGMKVVVRATPKLTKWGKFSLTVQTVQPVGEGSIKKAYEFLKKKLTAEGLFDKSRKRVLPSDLSKIGIISSTGAAGYADFIKIVNMRWGGLKIRVAHTQVQGLDAPNQMIRALRYFNEQADVQVIAMIRGGGSADDLACFNDEALVREVAISKIPVATGIGHEIDESLVDLAADVRASTPSNLAEILTRDRKNEEIRLNKNMIRVKGLIFDEIEQAKFDNEGAIKAMARAVDTKFIMPTKKRLNESVERCLRRMMSEIEPLGELCEDKIAKCLDKIKNEMRFFENDLTQKMKLLEVLNPEKVLKQGYAILSGKIGIGNVVKITTFRQEIEAVIKNINERKNNDGKI